MFFFVMIEIRKKKTGTSLFHYNASRSILFIQENGVQFIQNIDTQVFCVYVLQ